jgi:O-acetyl-ADP-ribose deacetylase (regulator of RNase III)
MTEKEKTVPEAVRYVSGDATRPRGDGPRIIAHVCNDIGAWGAGFALALSARWPQPERLYREWHDRSGLRLGETQLLAVGEGLLVANMIGQHGIRPEDGIPPVRYDAIRTALRRLAGCAADLGASVHMPRIGCGLAGGTWDKIEPLLGELTMNGIPVTVYDLPVPALDAAAATARGGARSLLRRRPGKGRA